MKVNKVELSVDDPGFCQQLKDPSLDHTFHIESLLSFREINKLRKGNANVRPPEARKRPFKAMKQTVEFTPQLFHIKNRGITYICSDAQYDEKTRRLTISIPAPSELAPKNGEVLRYGIADGGHTFQVINDTIRDEKDYENIAQWKMPFARVHFLVLSDKEEIEPIVEALNTSLQVKQYTLDEYQNKFESLKRALDDNGFDTELVAFRENEDKEWNVIEIIQRAGCFLKDRWSGTQPINMYKSKNKALKMFTSEETRPEFIQLYDVIKDIVTLPEFIQSKFSTGGIVPPKSLAKLRCVKPLKKTYTRPGTNYPTDHKIDMAALLPMAAGFRELLFKEDDRYEWRLHVDEVFDQCSAKLYNFLVDRSNKVFMSSQLASDVEYWAGCMQIIMNARQEILDKAGTKGIRRAKPVEVSYKEVPIEEEEEQEERVVRRAKVTEEEEYVEEADTDQE